MKTAIIAISLLRIPRKQTLREIPQRGFATVETNHPKPVKDFVLPLRWFRFHAQRFGQFRDVVMRPANDDGFAAISRLDEDAASKKPVKPALEWCLHGQTKFLAQRGEVLTRADFFHVS